MQSAVNHSFTKLLFISGTLLTTPFDSSRRNSSNHSFVLKYGIGKDFPAIVEEGQPLQPPRQPGTMDSNSNLVEKSDSETV